MTPNLDPTLDDLDDALSGPEPDWEADPVAPDAENVDRLLWRLQRLSRDRERDTEQAGLRMLQIEEWLAGRLARYDGQETWLRAALRRYHEAVLSLRPSAKSIGFPSGSLSSRMGQPEWEIDEETTLGWALPIDAMAKILEARVAYLDAVMTALDGVPRSLAVKIDPPGPPSLSRKGLKQIGTRRDEKGRAVGWGVTEDGEPILGVTVRPAERTFDVVLTGMTDTADVGDWTDEEETR